jgi:PadR family transcriptional regulator PadR
MPDKPSDLVQGTLDMLILKTLALQPMHGYGIPSLSNR